MLLQGYADYVACKPGYGARRASSLRHLFIPALRLLVAHGADGTVLQWAMLCTPCLLGVQAEQTAQCCSELCCTAPLAFGFLVAGGGDGTCHSGPHCSCKSLVLELLVAGGADGTVLQWDVSDGTLQESRFVAPSVTIPSPFGPTDKWAPSIR
jgi:hypothetical protein